MSFLCERTFSITVNPPTVSPMPFDKSIYVASVDKIFSLMGNRIVRCNATTGAVETVGAPFYSPHYNTADIAYCNGKFYVPICTTPQDSALYGTPSPLPTTGRGEWDIMIVDATTLAATPMQAYNIWTFALFTFNSWYQAIYNTTYGSGPCKLLIQGSMLYVFWRSFNKTYIIDLASPSTKYVVPNQCRDSEGWVELVWHPTFNGTGGLFSTDSWLPGIDVIYPPYGLTDDDDLFTGWATGTDPIPKGICYSPDNDRLYVTSGRQTLWKITPTYGALAIDATLTLPVGAKPIVARYNSVDKKVYMPNWDQNTISVLNTADDSVLTKTGFDCPVDCVFTPTKTFAVQRAAVGLKEIT